MSKKQNLPPLPLLPAQLVLSLGAWLSSPLALQMWSSALPGLSVPGQRQKLQNALQDEAKSRAAELTAGLSRYLEFPYRRKVEEPPCLWQRGHARLLDYGVYAPRRKQPLPALLVVPSLINRYYIMDLEADRSLLRYLAAQGFRPLVLDWGMPGAFEQSFGVEDYIRKLLLPALDFAHGLHPGRLSLAGYCMGGVFALAAARLRPSKINALALFATPWNFHCRSFAPYVLAERWHPFVEQSLAEQKLLPAELVQFLFYLTDPWVFEQKFRRFLGLDVKSRAAKDFVALERWVNDGVPITAAVARDTLLGWAQQNQLAAGAWKLAGKKINPAALTLPTFIAIPKNDHVVPLDCAWPLAEAMRHAQLLQPGAGHVGMMVGRHAARELWEPFASWLRCTAT
jgi:polyhydroxyalkanoate synthase